MKGTQQHGQADSVTLLGTRVASIGALCAVHTVGGKARVSQSLR
jgi:hypothetical protein